MLDAGLLDAAIWISNLAPAPTSGPADIKNFTGPATQSCCTLENSFCTVYVVPLATTDASCTTQMSPISPLMGSTQASGQAKELAGPTLASVTASDSSWLVTLVTISR